MPHSSSLIGQSTVCLTLWPRRAASFDVKSIHALPSDRFLCRRLLLVGVLFVMAVTARSQTFADWISDDGITVTGTIGGTSITFTRDTNGALGASNYTGTSAVFNNASYAPATPFTPSFGSSDAIEFFGKKTPAPVPTYTITFGTAVVDPILLIASNASTLTFSATPTFISGTTAATKEFVVSGNQVIGGDYNGAYTDANGTVKFTGTFTNLSFTAVYAGTGVQDGIGLQVGIAAIPEPSTTAAIAGLTMLGLAAVWRRRRA